MTRPAFSMSPQYLAAVQGIRELHRLALEGQDESPAADRIRDATDGPWEGLSATERKRVAGLSEDLYSISDPAMGEPLVMTPQAAAKFSDALEARERGELDLALELLRTWGKHVPPALLSHQRGATWLEAGDPATAVLFWEHAARLDPENAKYQAIFLKVLKMVDLAAAQERAEEIIQKAEDKPPVLVESAASVMIEVARTSTEVEAAATFHRIIRVLDPALSRIKEGLDGEIDRSAFLGAIVSLGFCFETLGENQKAVEYYTQGLQADPHNDGLLVARGILLYGSSPRAIKDLELAVRLRYPLVWPYFFLAHAYLASGRFDQCRAMCEGASGIDALNPVKSELAEWSAIAQSKLGFPAEMVRMTFEEAIRLDPSNDRAKRNLAAFEKSGRPPNAQWWEMRPEVAVRASVLSARRYERAG